MTGSQRQQSAPGLTAGVCHFACEGCSHVQAVAWTQLPDDCPRSLDRRPCDRCGGKLSIVSEEAHEGLARGLALIRRELGQ